MELEDYQFTKDLKSQIKYLSSQMKSSSQETLVMVLRNHFCLPVPEKWRKDSWITSAVDFLLNREIVFIKVSLTLSCEIDLPHLILHRVRDTPLISH